MIPPLIKILHIDDDAVMRMMVKKSLERSSQNFEVASSSNHTEFLDHLNHFTPDLLIIDVVMPTIDGPSLLKKIREAGNKTPAIFMTGQDSLEFDDPVRMAPVIGMLHKPFSPITLGEDLTKMWHDFYKSANN